MLKIGLIAGNGRFPLIIARAAKKIGHNVVAIGLMTETMPKLAEEVNSMHWVNLGELQKVIDILKNEGISKIIMAGKIKKTVLYSKKLVLDDRTKKLFESLKNNNDDSILKAFVDELELEGLNVLDSVAFINELLPEEGCLTKLEPTEEEMEDIYYAWKRAKLIAGMDIGQTIIVKNKAVVAVEAIEGTDEAIRRGGKHAKEGIVVVKVSKPNQDKRFDMPVIGYETVKVLAKVKASAIVIDAGKTIFLDREKSIKLAEKNNIKIIAIKNNGSN